MTHDIGRTMKHARKLLRSGVLRRVDLCLLDAMAFSCRTPRQTRLSASYATLCRLVRAARATVVAGVARLIAAGLIRRHKRGRLVVWGRGVAWRQMPNVYELLECQGGKIPAGLFPQGSASATERENPPPFFPPLSRRGISPTSEFNPWPVQQELGRCLRGWSAQPPVRTVAEQIALLRSAL